MPVRTWARAGEAAQLTALRRRRAPRPCCRCSRTTSACPTPTASSTRSACPTSRPARWRTPACITYREVALLLDPATAPLAVQKRVAEVITHELAHQWFGNLVTMVWWDDLWLNEAFATWMAYKIVDRWQPEWRMWLDFEGQGRGAAPRRAASPPTPSAREVRNADEAGESFDAITYEKGGAVLRMIEGYLGAEPLPRGHPPLHAHGTARQRDGRRPVARAGATASGQPIVELANGWIRQTGYPLVSVSQRGGKRAPGAAALLLGPRRSAGADALAGAAGAALRRAARAARAAARGGAGVRDGRPGGLGAGQRRGARLLPHRLRSGPPAQADPRGRRAAARGADGLGLRSMGALARQCGEARRLLAAPRRAARRARSHGARRGGRAAQLPRASRRRRRGASGPSGLGAFVVRACRRRAGLGAQLRRGRRAPPAPGGGAARAHPGGPRSGRGGRSRSALPHARGQEGPAARPEPPRHRGACRRARRGSGALRGAARAGRGPSWTLPRSDATCTPSPWWSTPTWSIAP